MKLEDYFEFEQFPTCDRIRFKGSRIALEHVLPYYFAGETAEDIVRQHYRSLTVEQMAAAIAYYEQNKTAVDGYLERAHAADEAAYQEYLKQEPSPVAKRLRALAQQREAEKARQP